MGVTYTSALNRDIRRSTIAARQLRAPQLLLPMTSLVAILAIGLAYGGRTRTVGVGGPATGSRHVVDLNAVSEASQLESPLAVVFAHASDRRFAAQALFQYLLSTRSAGRDLPNVGTIAAATVTADAIERTPSLVVHAERLRTSRARAAQAGAPVPRSLPVLTSDDLATLKPMLTVRTPDAFARLTLTYAALYVSAFYAVFVCWALRSVRGDSVLLCAAHLLTALGFALLLSRPDPLRDVVLFVRYTQAVCLGLGVMVLVSLVDFRKAAFLKFSFIPLALALVLSLVLLLFGHGPGASSAKVNLGPVQPVEAIRLLLALFLAGYFARRWELLRQVRSHTIRHYQLPGWLNLPRIDYVLPVLIGVSAALVFFFLQKDLGPALFLSCVFLAMYAVARGRIAMPLAGFAVLVAGFYVGYRLQISTTLADRVRMWQSPWDNAVRGGDQVAQSIWALSTGGVFGTGLGLGDARYVPAGYTDLVLAAVGEELGAAGLVAVAIVYLVMALRGFRIGLKAANDYAFFLAVAVTLFLIVPVLVMTAGMLGVTPLTGVVTPFLSYGGSAMVANFAALGMLMSIQTGPAATEAAAPFRMPARYLGGALAVAAVGLLAVIVNVQLLHADEYVVKPHLSLQGDGVRRYQYNPRVLDVVRLIPRGTVYDRTRLPLATADAAVVRETQDAFDRLGVARDASCAEPIERCYPLGGATFHVLGDSATRLNWTATNTSYIERDAEDRLRGFEDHATLVPSVDLSGQRTTTLRRDYREVVPLLRHRHTLDHAAAKALVTRTRELQVTLDARLQMRVATILANYAGQSATRRAAAIVLDVDTGDVLAVVSHPWPVLDRAPRGAATTESDALVDRARYGLYPPGSTFKLVTAAAALGQGLTSSSQTFTCSLLPNGRVGARIAGRSRPIRDDVLDKHPHGTIGMHDGMVHSCNAYFAQLAMRLGPSAILDAATRLGISVASSGAVSRVRETLPQAGYGQGDVLASPLRMARVAAAIAGGGVLRDVRLDMGIARRPPVGVLLQPDAAALLAGYMRDAVTGGTGRRLRSNPWRIAGKTGTAELTGAPSHSWFVGFAPYGAATKRIAFAVIVENAGYGGLAAASAAGEIVTAAAASGLIK